MANASAAADTSSTPVDWLISGLQVMHDSTGMPWWGTIIGATVLVRAATLPVTVFQMQNVAKLAQIKPEMERLTDRMKDLVARGEHEVAQKYRAELKDLFKRNNASPMRSMASAFVQMPVFMSFFFALRRMAEEVPSFWEEGALWFENLSTSDPYYILPVISGGLMYINITLGSDMPNAAQSQIMTKVMKGISLASIPLTAYFPSALFMYWIPSNFISLLQGRMLRLAPVRTALGLPPISKVEKSSQTKEKLAAQILQPSEVFSQRPIAPKVDHNTVTAKDDLVRPKQHKKAAPAKKSKRGKKH
mmetsp:Transcript_13207/g.34621  ORF Transcript_13207/g.34621 Transcript_13207/m.34621 type:complete len:304 (+) Transcript_13207:290-1201(+)